MKITVGRLKTIINEEIEHFKESHLEPGDEGHDEDYEEKYGDMNPEEEILSRLEDVLEEWEEKEYDSDEDRWEEYHKDIKDLVEEFRDELEDEPDDDEEDDDDDEEERPKKNGREVITGEKENSLEEIIKQEIMNMLEGESLEDELGDITKNTATSFVDMPVKLKESKDHPGKKCKEAHPDASHEEWLKTKKKGPSTRIKLSAKQSKKMDTDKDGDIDAKDMKNLKNKKKEKPKSEKKEDKPKKSSGSKVSKNFPY